MNVETTLAVGFIVVLVVLHRISRPTAVRLTPLSDTRRTEIVRGRRNREQEAKDRADAAADSSDAPEHQRLQAEHVRATLRRAPLTHEQRRRIVSVRDGNAQGIERKAA